MLKLWVFVMYISGKPVVTEQQPSEAKCNDVLVRLVTAQRDQGIEAIGACYLRATSNE